jgi:glycosyltransferase involved in cell wall biosynthesis
LQWPESALTPVRRPNRCPFLASWPKFVVSDVDGWPSQSQSFNIELTCKGWNADLDRTDSAGGAVISMEKTSVIIPVYNGARYIVESINSVLDQGDEVQEIIVVDDGSSDETLDAIKTVIGPRVRLIAQKNRGVAAARNAGLGQVDPRAKFVVFLDHDDILMPGAIATLRRAMEADPARSGVFGQVVTIDGGGIVQNDGRVHRSHRERYVRLRKDWRPNTGAVALTDLLSATCAITPGQLMMRVAVVREIGGFNPRCIPSDDWDLLVNLAGRGILWGLPEVVLQYRVHDTNTSKRKVRMRLAGLSLRLEWIKRLPWALKGEVARAYLCRIIDRGVVRHVLRRPGGPPGLAG